MPLNEGLRPDLSAVVITHRAAAHDLIQKLTDKVDKIKPESATWSEVDDLWQLMKGMRDTLDGRVSADERG